MFGGSPSSPFIPAAGGLHSFEQNRGTPKLHGAEKVSGASGKKKKKKTGILQDVLKPLPAAFKIKAFPAREVTVILSQCLCTVGGIILEGSRASGDYPAIYLLLTKVTS